MALTGLQIRGLIAATSTVTVFGITVGLTLPLLALVLEKQGYSEGQIGLSATAQFLGIMGFAPLAPRAIQRFGLVRLMAGCLIICASCLALLPVFQTYSAWLLIRVLFGGAEGLLLVAGETWINQAIDDRVRGRITGIYGTFLAGGFGIGPLIIAFTGIDGSAPFMLGAVMVMAALGPLAFGRAAAPMINKAPKHAVIVILRMIPIAGAAAVLFGLLDGGLIALLAVYGLTIGLDTGGAAQLVTILMVGAIFLQIPIGWIADSTDRVVVLIGCGLLAATLLSVAPFVGDQMALSVLLFGLGGLMGSFWLLSMALLGDRFRDGDLAAGNVGLTLAYGIGSVSGPAIGGYAMEFWSPHGLMASLAVFALAFAVFGTFVRPAMR